MKKFSIESRNIFKTSNICIFIYIVLNLLLIWSILSWFNYTAITLWYSFLLYAASLLIALSPIGELILRLQTGCKPLKRKDQKDILMPIFEEVYAKACEITPNLPTGIKIYISQANTPNAFATGRRTICVNAGLLKLPPEQIKAILAHEFGHIAHRDTYILQCVLVGNLIVTVLVTALRVAALVATTIAKIDALLMPNDNVVGKGMQWIFASVAQLLTIIAYNVFMWFWSKLGILLCMKTSRENEYEADRFAGNCGYGKDLVEAFKFLSSFDGDRSKGVFALLESSHPDFDSRIAKLQELDNAQQADKVTNEAV